MTPQDMAALHAPAFHRGWSAEEFETLLSQKGAVFVHTDVGFALARAIVDEAELLTIVVAREARGGGVGLALMGDLIETLGNHGVTRLFLEVAADNDAARALYDKLGFEQDALRKEYYQTPSGSIDALVLSRSL